MRKIENIVGIVGGKGVEMTRKQAIEEINKVFEPAFANYIITALTEGATVSDKAQEQDTDFVPVEIEFLGNKGYGYLYKPQQIIVTGYYTLEAFKHFGGTYKEKEGGENG